MADRELTVKITTTENTSRIFTELMLEILERHPELAKEKKAE